MSVLHITNKNNSDKFNFAFAGERTTEVEVSMTGILKGKWNFE